MSDDPRRYAPAAARNRDAIRAALTPLMPDSGVLLEVASGSGEHALHFAETAPTGLMIQPSDPDPGARASIDAWAAGRANILPALALDAAGETWPAARAEMIFCANMIHIAPWAAGLGLLKGAGRILPPGGRLALYGPFFRDGVETAAGNVAFDASLRARNPEWGVRRLDDVATAAAAEGLRLAEVIEMPANNCLVLFRRGLK